MFHYTIFGVQDADLPARRFTILTLFGITEVRRPTLADRIRAHQNPATAGRRTFFDRLSGTERGVIVTLFGITELITPSLVDEFVGLRGLISSGAVSREELDNLVNELSQDDETTAMTIFGVCSTGKRARQKQIKELDVAEQAGIISRRDRRRLDDLIDAPRSAAATIIGQLVVNPT